MKKKSKAYVILIAVLFLFLFVMFLFFGNGNIFESKKTVTLLVDHDTVWTYKNRKWDFTSSQNQMKEYDWQKFHVYLNGKNFGMYSLWRDDKWYAFDQSKNAVNLDGDFFAYQANYDISVGSFELDEIIDTTFVKKMLDDNSLSASSKFTSSYQISFDIDSDGIKEDFYGITNVFPMDFHPDTIFSFVFMVKNNEIYSIFSDVDSNYSYNGCKPYFSNFVDINQDSTYELILSCGRYSDATPIRSLYQFSDNKFKILISNE